jgi:hypothetical protein
LIIKPLSRSKNCSTLLYENQPHLDCCNALSTFATGHSLPIRLGLVLHNVRSTPKADMKFQRNIRRDGPIVLQKSKVAGLGIFRENTKREAIADSYNLNRATEVAYEFNARR